VSLLCICIVFIPMFFLSGVARFLFVADGGERDLRHGLLVLLSRTLVADDREISAAQHSAKSMQRRRVGPPPPKIRWCASARFREGFARLRAGLSRIAALAIEHRRLFCRRFSELHCGIVPACPISRRNFFPQVDGGQMLLHVRAPVGMRNRETAGRFAGGGKGDPRGDPPSEVAAVADNIGTYLSSINTIYNNTGTIGESDGDIQISLNPGHAPTADYVSRLREELPRPSPA